MIKKIFKIATVSIVLMTLFMMAFLCGADTNDTTKVVFYTLFFYTPIIVISVFVWKKFVANVFKITLSDMTNVAQVIIALCAVFALLSTNNAKVEGFYYLNQDDKIVANVRALFDLRSTNTDIELDPLLTARISLIIATTQIFQVNEITSSIFKHWDSLNLNLSEFPKMRLSKNDNKIHISIINAEIFRQLIEDGFKKRWYLRLLSKLPGTKIVITIDDTYDQTHIIYPTKNTMKKLYSLTKKEKIDLPDHSVKEIEK